MSEEGFGDGTVTLSSETIHALSNHLGIILGFVELILAEAADDDPHRQDLLEIRQAAKAAAALMKPRLTPEEP